MGYYKKTDNLNTWDDITKKFQNAYNALGEALEDIFGDFKSTAIEIDEMLNEFKELEKENVEKNKEWQKFIGFPIQEKIFNPVYKKKIRKNNRRLKCNFDYRENKD